MLMYCETNYHNGTVIFDVGNLNALKEWYCQKNYEQEWVPEDKRSLIEIKQLTYLKHKGPREGFWYDIPIQFWNNCTFDFEIYSFFASNKSLLFRFQAKFSNEIEYDFTEYKLKDNG